MTQKGKSVTLTLYSSPEGRYHWGGGCPYGQSLWGVRVRRLWCPGSEGSEGSACLWQAGSKGGGIALRAMSFIARLAGTGLHWRPPPPPLRGPPPPASGGRQGLRAQSSPPCYLPTPFPGGWVASAARRKGADVHSSLFYPFFYGPFDFYADFSKMKVNLPIVETDNMDMTAFKESGSFHVVGQFFFSVVLAPVQFYDQTGLWTVKVTDVVTYDFLSVKAKAVFSKEKIPQFSFFLCHVTSKFFCFFQERAVFRHHVFLIHRILRMKP